LNYKDASLELQLYDPKAEAFLKTQEYVHSQITTVGQTSEGMGGTKQLHTKQRSM
jgi:HAE1 family hydrophobic/amphiphilic exporter-1